MSLITRLVDLVSDTLGPRAGADPAPESDAHLAVAALLVHVARVDGRWLEAEKTRLLDLLGRRFDLTSAQAERLLAEGDIVDREADDVASLVDRLGRDLPRGERHRLLGMAYAVAAADGRLHEFEDSLVWRLGHLFGFSEPEIGAARANALAAAGVVDGPAEA